MDFLVEADKSMIDSNYRRCVGIFVLQKRSGLIFAAERINEPGAWQIPQGGAEDGEEDYDAALRELREETGIRSVKYLANTKGRHNYDFPTYILEKRKKRGWADYKGQSIKFFLFEFIGNESEINLASSKEIEFSHWKWIEAKKIVDQMIDFKKEAIYAGAKELELV